FNRYRFKTGQQLYNEGKALKEIEAVRQERARRAKIAYYQTTGETVEKPSKGETKTRDIIAQSIGLISGLEGPKRVCTRCAVARSDVSNG
ncbi:MAG: hypothetical protein V1823_04820, partial [Chloroflexota bacterium]